MGELEEYRSKIRETDRKLLSLVKERLSIGARLVEIKHENGLPTIDADAEHVTIERLVQFAKETGVEEVFAQRLAELLIEETVRVEETERPQRSKDQILKEMFELTEKLTMQGKKITRFEVGEPNFPAQPIVIRGLEATFRRKKVIGYGPAAGLPELREVIAQDLNEQHGTNVDPDQILVTPGGRFAIFASIVSYVSSLQRVILPQPLWPAYEECVKFVNGRVIPLATKFEDKWDLDLGALEVELKRGARVLVLNSPCNPTGRVIGKTIFDQIVELAAKYNVTILSDEVYDRYVRTPAPSILESGYDNFVYVNSFSKRFSLTGWRIAYLVTTKENASRIKRVIQTAVTCVPEFVQNAALVAMKRGRKEAQIQINAIMDKVTLTCRELAKIDVSFNKPDVAFYVFPKVNRKNFDSLEFARKLLEEHRVSISPGQSFGNYPEFFRLSVSLPKKQIPGAVKAIGTAIESWK